MNVCLSGPLSLATLTVPYLDRHARQRVILGPRPVVVLHVRQAEQFVQDKPGMRGALADPAVGNGVLSEIQPGASAT